MKRRTNTSNVALIAGLIVSVIWLFWVTVAAQPPVVNSTLTIAPPTINGVISGGEWQNCTNITLNRMNTSIPFNTTINGLLCIMNDDIGNLYAAVQVPPVNPDDYLMLDFDSGQRGVRENGGEDAVGFGIGNRFGPPYSSGCGDLFWNGTAVGGPWWWPDITANSTCGVGSNAYEFSKPLNSGDPQDMGIGMGDPLGFRIEMWSNSSQDWYRYPVNSSDRNASDWVNWADLDMAMGGPGGGPGPGGSVFLHFFPDFNFPPTDIPVKIEFFTPSAMNHSSVEGNLTIREAGNVTNSYSLTWNGFDGFRDPATVNINLSANTRYNITITGGVNLNGTNVTNAPFSVEFITGNGASGGPGGGPAPGEGGGSTIYNLWLDTDNTGDPGTPDGTAVTDFVFNDSIAENGVGLYYIGVGLPSAMNVTISLNGTLLEKLTPSSGGPQHTTNPYNFSAEAVYNLTVNTSIERISWLVSVGSQFDNARPVAKFAPQNGSQNIPADVTILAHFTERMNTSSVEAGSILRERDNVSVVQPISHFGWSPNNDSFKADISSTLNPNTWYRLKLNGTDLAGNPLEGNLTSDFKTGFNGKENLSKNQGLDFSSGLDNSSSNDLFQDALSTVNGALAVKMGPVPLNDIASCQVYNASRSDYSNKTALADWTKFNSYCIYTQEGGYAKIFITDISENNTIFKWSYNGSGPKFPSLDSDYDGINDKQDACPDIPGAPNGDSSMNGCPDTFGFDSDNDGIPDPDDFCPYEPGPFTSGGCQPSGVSGDSDFDGIPDNAPIPDACPNEFGFPNPDPTMHGCPMGDWGFTDSDGDGLSDGEDVCPFSRGPKYTGGCPVDGNDKDFDGLLDSDDHCPDVAGPPFTGGCPLSDLLNDTSINDTDRDGVPDNDDNCQFEPGPPFTAGCPSDVMFGSGFNDTDMDGVPDYDPFGMEVDKCPNAAGSPINMGCPLGDFDDVDRDGIPDYDDACPFQAGPPFTGGCPLGDVMGNSSMKDGDLDGVPDDDDACPSLFGNPFFAGCPGDNSSGGFVAFNSENDQDNDGITDDVDSCPAEYGSPFTGGCPALGVFGDVQGDLNDSDRDGMPNALDKCKTLAGPPFTGGCPLTNITGNNNFKDNDFDGVPDEIDDCPLEPGTPFTGGCPPKDSYGSIFGHTIVDTDVDGVPDFEDACPLRPGPLFSGGCPPAGDDDQDLDGLNDTVDRCVNLPGPKMNKGCPQVYSVFNSSMTDIDRDGVPSNMDSCPGAPGPMENDGCPPGDLDKDGVMNASELGLMGLSGDTDNDGVFDEFDFCPSVPGPIFNDGCPPEEFKDNASWFNQSFVMGDKDTDGVPDMVDKCPNKWGAPFMGGCPFGMDRNNKSFSMDNDADGVADSEDNCPGASNPSQKDTDNDGKGDFCDFPDIELPLGGVVFEPGVNISWGPRISFPENISVTFNGSITKMLNVTFNVNNSVVLPPLGRILDFEINYTPQPDQWKDFSGNGLQLNASGFLDSKQNTNGTAMMPRNNVSINFTSIYAPINFTNLVKDANSSTITSNVTPNAVNLSSAGVLIDTFMNATPGDAVIEAAVTGLNPEHGLVSNASVLDDPLGDTPYLKLNCSANYTSALKNATIKVPIPDGTDVNNMDIRIKYFNLSTGQWDALNTTVSGGYAIANTTHCSVYALGGTSTSQGSSSSSSGGGGGGGGAGGLGPSEEVLLVANSIDSELAVDFLTYLNSNNIKATLVNATGFSDEMKFGNRLIIILGGPDAPDGIGGIVRGLLTDDEAAAIRASGSQLIFTKFDTFTYRYTSKQKVIILAGSDRTNTQAAEGRHSDEAKTRVLR